MPVYFDKNSEQVLVERGLIWGRSQDRYKKRDIKTNDPGERVNTKSQHGSSLLDDGSLVSVVTHNLTQWIFAQ